MSIYAIAITGNMLGIALVVEQPCSSYRRRIFLDFAVLGLKNTPFVHKYEVFWIL